MSTRGKMDFEDFLLSEQSSRDTIDVKRIYIDMADDLVAGILLSQIIFWYLPARDGKSKLRVEHEGHRWIAKNRSDWWEECRISEKQYDRAIGLLEEKGLVVTDTTLFAGKPSKLLRLDYEKFVDAYEQALRQQNRGEKRSSPKVNNEIDQRGSTITETTTETTPKTSTGTTDLNIFKIYENEIGLLTAHISEELKFAEKEFPADWIRDALHICAEQNKRNWKYALAILTRWRAEGRADTKQKPSNGNGHAARAASHKESYIDVMARGFALADEIRERKEHGNA